MFLCSCNHRAGRGLNFAFTIRADLFLSCPGCMYIVRLCSCFHRGEKKRDSLVGRTRLKFSSFRSVSRRVRESEGLREREEKYYRVLSNTLAIHLRNTIYPGATTKPTYPITLRGDLIYTSQTADFFAILEKQTTGCARGKNNLPHVYP